MRALVFSVVFVLGILTTTGQEIFSEDRVDYTVMMNKRALENKVDIFFESFGSESKSLMITSSEFKDDIDIKDFLLEAKWAGFDYIYGWYEFTQICVIDTTRCFGSEEMRLFIYYNTE